jgi:hypothetical protein
LNLLRNLGEDASVIRMPHRLTNTATSAMIASLDQVERLAGGLSCNGAASIAGSRPINMSGSAFECMAGHTFFVMSHLTGARTWGALE